jgi:hypothetical protein
MIALPLVDSRLCRGPRVYLPNPGKTIINKISILLNRDPQTI